MTSRLRAGLERNALLTAVVYTGAGMLPLYLLSAQVLQVEADIGFGVTQLGVATACFFASAAIASNVGGGVVSRLGPSVGIRIGISTTIVCCLVASVAVAPWMIPIAAVIGGIGNGMIQVGSNVAIFDGVSRGRRGIAFGAKQASVPAASILAGLSLPAIGLVFGWRWVFVLAAGLTLLLLVVTPRWGRGEAPRRVEEPIRRLSPSMIWLAIGGFSGAAAGSLSLFVVPSAVRVGIGEAAAGAVLAVSSALVVALRIWAGWLVDRRRSSGHHEMAVMTAVGAVAAFVLAMTTVPSLYLVWLPIAMLGAWGWPSIIYYTIVTTYPEIPARASGMGLSSNLSGTLVGPLVVGTLAGQDSYPAAWVFVAVCATLATIAFVAARRATEPARLSR